VRSPKRQKKTKGKTCPCRGGKREEKARKEKKNVLALGPSGTNRKWHDLWGGGQEIAPQTAVGKRGGLGTYCDYLLRKMRKERARLKLFQPLLSLRTKMNLRNTVSSEQSWGIKKRFLSLKNQGGGGNTGEFGASLKEKNEKIRPDAGKVKEVVAPSAWRSALGE